MDLSTFSFTLGVIELLMGIPMLLYPQKTTTWLLSILEGETSVRIVGAVLAVFGALVLREHRMIGTDPTGLMTFMAWATFIKGLILSWKPHTFESLRKKYASDSSLQMLAAVAMVVLGGLFLYAAELV